MKRIAIQLILAAGLALPAYAQQMDHSAMGGASATQSAPSIADGVVRKVDRKAKTIILKHGAIPSLDMGPMTMQYRVKDASLLDKVKAGDEVKFSAVKAGGEYVVTHLERAAK